MPGKLDLRGSPKHMTGEGYGEALKLRQGSKQSTKRGGDQPMGGAPVKMGKKGTKR